MAIYTNISSAATTTLITKDSGVGGRIRKAARRIRGDKEDGGRANRPDSGSTKAQPKRTRKKV